jgi:glycine hydroxymethyltransferase
VQHLLKFWQEKLPLLPEELREIIELTINHNTWRKFQTINLIASENVMSPLALAAYVSDMMHRYAEGKPFKRYYQGTRYVDEVEVRVMKLMGELLGGAYVDPRPISGTVANATVYRTVTKCGDKAVVAPVQAGAHVSHTRFGTLGGLCIEHIEMPYDAENMNVDVDKAVKMIEEVKPSLVILGGSVYLFPHPVKEIADAAHAVGAKLMYDAAHVLGLIIGKRWRNPLDYGADFLTASTHKTFPGPQGGIVATRSEELYKAASRVVFPVFVSNHHLHRLPALAVTAIEMKYFGESYADQIVRNAKALAEALAAEGFKVLGEHLGYTKSHQVVLDVRAQGGGAKAAELLERANIIVNKNLLPYDPPDAIKNPSGLRLGVQEMTRFGMKEDDMKEIARFMRRVLIDKEDPEKIAKEVTEYRKNYLEVKYCFNVNPLEDGKLYLLI